MPFYPIPQRSFPLRAVRPRIYGGLPMVVATITGTATSGITESGIVSGGLTIIVTLLNDFWVQPGTGPIGSTANTQALIDAIDSDLSEATGWDAVVKTALVPATHVVRTSDTVCTITLPAVATYNITATETITVSIPAAVLYGGLALTGSPTFTVSPTSVDRIQRFMLMGVS